MATVELTSDNFEDTINKGGIVLVDFWASWCAPCRAFAPVFEAASKRHEDVVFGKVDTQANRDIAGALDIQAIPTIMAFRDGVMVFNQAGMLPAAALDKLIEKVKEIDMDDLRKKIAEAEKAEADKASGEKKEEPAAKA